MGSSNIFPSSTSSGTVTSPVAFTPTGGFNTNCSYEGYYWREGKFLCCIGTIRFTGQPNLVNFTVDMPAGFNIDTGVLGTDFQNKNVGDVVMADTGVASYYGFLYPINTVSLGGLVFNAASTYLAVQQISRVLPFTIGNLDTINYSFKVPCTQYT